MLDKLKPLTPYLRRYWKQLAWGGISTVLYNVIKVLIPLVIGNAIDDMQRGLTEQKVLRHALILLLIAALSAIFLYITRQVIIGASREIEFDLRNDIFANLERQSPNYYHTHRTGDIMARTTNDLNAVRMLLGPAIMYSANTIVFMAAALPFMYRISPKLTFFAFVPMPAASVLVQYFGNRIHRRFERIQAMYSDISAKAQENFSGARLIRAFAQEDAEIASFETANREYIKRSLYLVRLMAMLWPTLEFVLGLSLMITLLVGGHEVVSHRISVGQFTAFNVYMVQLTWPLIAVGWVVNLFQRGTASIIRIDELLKQQPDIADAPMATDSPVTGDIELRNLTFAYPDAPPVLHDINLRIPAGSSLAIVGPTGSGKSTLVGLIPRLHDAAPGTVLIDGQPVRNFTLSALRKSIGFVPQETFLFSETIRQNIAFGKPDASPEQVEEAATIAHISTEIQEFPKGFDTEVGERGLTLSGGQKQRTAIARAVIRDPKVLILDDALASVDTYTEERILSGLKRVMEGRTTIFISHRISTARNADQIAVLVAGRIAELGTHEELIARNGYYTSLFEKQRLEEELAVAT
ncbi:MAG TPA: ABC transporter ATP-binding protein [Edaphobacter sp.]|jgi:ATP-binding cassette subfamily B protein|nr:ABC transporter ATP-binding protein [Edaphobacter sp.]